MKISILAIGKLKEQYWRAACDEYLKRCRPYARLSIQELPDVDPGKLSTTAALLDQEAQAIFAAIPERAQIIVLDIEGTEYSSENLSAWIDDQALQGNSDFVFVIGGSYGLAPQVIKRAKLRLSFGPITLPHNLARVVLLEQIYRAFKISRGEPYHK